MLGRQHALFKKRLDHGIGDRRLVLRGQAFQEQNHLSTGHAILAKRVHPIGELMFGRAILTTETFVRQDAERFMVESNLCL